MPSDSPNSTPAPDPLETLRASRAGEVGAAEELLPLVYAELRRLAASYLAHERTGHTLQPTALVNEAYLRLIDRRSAEEADREHFLAIAAQTMRRVLVDHARARATDKRGGKWARVSLAADLSDQGSNAVDLIELDDLLRRLMVVDKRAARVVELRFFGGLGVDAIASILGVSDRTVDNDWFFARGWLTRAMGEEA